MQQPKMIVLALLGTGLRYGFEMEDLARRTNMRQWAKIGMSTIYKALADLEREGAIVVHVEESDKGPARKAYSLTQAGRKKMVALIEEALASDVSIYSERIAGLVFVPLLGPKRARLTVNAAIDALEHADIRLSKNLEDAGIEPIGRAVVEYYRTVYEAEREAMRRVLETVKETGKT